MGNVQAAGANVPSPPLAPPPPTGVSGPVAASASGDAQSAETAVPEEVGVGSFEDLHRKTKDIFPVNFEGAKLIINKALSSHFQINHTMVMSSLQPSGYRFGCTYVGSQQFSQTESYPILIGEADVSGNLNAQIIHQFTKNDRIKFVSQIQNGKWLGTQFSGELKNSDYTATLTLGNVDLVNSSGVAVGQYLQSVTDRLDLGAELLYQFGPNVPGGQIGIYTVAGRYTTPKWLLSGNLTPLAGGLHSCFYRKINDNVQMGVELEGSLRNQECTGTIAYQIEVPSANITCKGQVDSNFCVGATLEKRLAPLPFTFALSGFLNHVKGTYRFGVGLIVG